MDISYTDYAYGNLRLNEHILIRKKQKKKKTKLLQ